MPYIRVAIFKNSQLFGADRVWNNIYTFDAPYSAAEIPALDLANYVQRNEQGLHMSHVQYREVVVKPHGEGEDASPTGAQVFIPGGVYTNGFQPTPDVVLDPRTVLCVRKYPDNGYIGRFFFRGVIDPRQVETFNDGRIGLKNTAFYDNIVQGWISDIYNHTAARLVVGQGFNRYKTEIRQAPCIKLQALGATLMRASPRVQAKSSPKGASVFQEIEANAQLFGIWQGQINEWLQFNQDFVPVDAKDHSIELLGRWKAALQAAKTYAEGDPQNGQATQAVPKFRFGPQAETISEIGDAAINAYPKDIKAITDLHPYLDVSGDMAMTHSDTELINERLTKWGNWLGSLVWADWLNPANQTTQG